MLIRTGKFTIFVLRLIHHRLFAFGGFGWNIRADKLDDLGVLRSPRAVDHYGYGGARMLADPEYGLAAAYYLVDQLDDDYVLHAKITNILYSALD
jgi:CubicO group peptidase (beta-lactamase class C family)